MKALLVAAVLALTASAQAAEKDWDAKFVCKGREDRGTPEHITMELTAVDKTINDVNELEPVPYRLVVKNADRLWTDVIVQAKSEDVYFGFEGKDEKGQPLSGSMYLDELEETDLTYASGLTLNFACER